MESQPKNRIEFQLILNPIRDWNPAFLAPSVMIIGFQLILNPIRDWNPNYTDDFGTEYKFQLILNPIRDWNPVFAGVGAILKKSSN